MSRISRAALVLSAAAFSLIASALPPWSARFDAAAQSPPTLVELRDLSELRARFNADSGFARLILLVSPT
jgi:hypothetical protein